jgi:DNA-binding response OmpR family regulator
MLEEISPPAVPVTGAKTRRIAVLDDDIRFIRMTERMLKAERIDVQPITTLDVDEAIRVIAEAHCDAALVDVYMYGSALGFTMIERLRQNPATAALPIIVASGARQEIGRRVAFLQMHGCGVLVKPFNINDLLLRLRDVAALAPVEAPPQVARMAATGRQHAAETLPGGT